MIFITFTKHKRKDFCTFYKRNTMKIIIFKLTPENTCGKKPAPNVPTRMAYTKKELTKPRHPPKIAEFKILNSKNRLSPCSSNCQSTLTRGSTESVHADAT